MILNSKTSPKVCNRIIYERNLCFNPCIDPLHALRVILPFAAVADFQRAYTSLLPEEPTVTAAGVLDLPQDLELAALGLMKVVAGLCAAFNWPPASIKWPPQLLVSDQMKLGRAKIILLQNWLETNGMDILQKIEDKEETVEVTRGQKKGKKVNNIP